MQRIQVTVFAGLSILLINAVYSMDSCNPPSYGTNGCSIPWYLQFLFKMKDNFTSACNEHDVCYACGNSNGTGRESCDRKFWYDMEKICTSDSRVENAENCLSEAYSFWFGATILGWWYYSNPSYSWCNESWVPSCLSRLAQWKTVQTEQ